MLGVASAGLRTAHDDMRYRRFVYRGRFAGEMAGQAADVGLASYQNCVVGDWEVFEIRCSSARHRFAAELVFGHEWERGTSDLIMMVVGRRLGSFSATQFSSSDT